MFEKMKLRQRILLGYLAPLLLLLVAMGLVFINLQLASRQAVLLEGGHNRQEQAQKLISGLGKMQRATRGCLLMKEPVTKQNFQLGKEAFHSAAKALKERVMDAQQQEKLKTLMALAEQQALEQVQLLTMVDEGQTTAAIEQYRNARSAGHAFKLEELAADFERGEEAQLATFHLAYNKAIDAVIFSIIAGMLSGTLLALVIAFWLAATVSRDITLNATKLSAASSEIAAAVEQHERTASQQAVSANETSATIEELSASAQQSSDQAANAALLADQAGQATVQGGDAIRQAVTAMASLKDKMADMAQQTLRLGDQTSQIGGIASLVKDLSSEINMLALNAAVEAARAGEHGKGFAVVASEVRKLANESKKSAEQASALVVDIQKSTNASVLMTEEGTRTVTEVAQLANQVGELFEGLSGMALSVNESAQQVVLNARQQADAFGQVVEATNGIAAGARETADGIGQTKIGLQSMNEAAEELRAIVG